MKKIAVQGILYDEKSSYLKGPALAPPLIRRSFQSPAYNLFAERGLEVKQFEDLGDFEIADYFQIETITQQHLNKEFRLLTLGGDHSITFPIIKAYAQHYDDIHILQIDAHSDLYHDFEGDPYSHACPFARIMEGSYAKHLTQVGIRAITGHQRAQAEKFKVEIHEMRNYYRNALPLFNHPLYISLDMDAFDPAFAPGVSHQEPGGMTSRQVIDLIHSIEAPIIGVDIVEYNPTRDVSDITAALAGKLMKELLAKMIV